MENLAERLSRDPHAMLEASYADGFRLGPAELETLHLAGIRRRFEQLRDRVPALKRQAEEQGVGEVDDLESAAALLFPHTVYKSYPLSWLEKGRYDRLTRWLDGLTALDLSAVDASGCESVDEWIDRLDETTELRVAHTFGTSGKLSILPRTAGHWRLMARLNGLCLRDWHGTGEGPDVLSENLPLIQPSYRYGASAQLRGVREMVQQYAGGEDNALFLYPDRFSADIASLAGRLRAAEARGEEGRVEISPALARRREEFLERERRRGEDLEKFFREAIERFGGQRVFLFGVWPMLYDAAVDGLERGLEGVFAPGSVLTTGGGTKGRDLPEDYRETVFRFLGFDDYYEFYGMSELMANFPRCAAGNYHIPPVIVPFLLDPDDSTPLPRRDGQTGRFAFFDLLPDSYWGGLISGDRVTMGGWQTPCRCGRHGPYCEPDIARYSELRGGDDKVSCAGAPEAHDRAVEHLLRTSGGERDR